MNSYRTPPDEPGKRLIDRLRTMAPLTFRSQAVLFLVPAIVIMSLVYTIDSISTERKILRNEIIKRGETIASIAARNAEIPVLSENPEQLKNSALSVMEIKDIAFVSFLNKHFEPLYYEGRRIPLGLKPNFNADTDLSISFSEHHDLFEFIAPIVSVRAQEGLFLLEGKDAPQVREHIGWARVALSKDVMSKTERGIIVRSGFLAIVFTIVGILLVYLFISLATRPLLALITAVKKVGKGEHYEVESTSPKSEIGRLSVEFNRMSRAIREREDELIKHRNHLEELVEARTKELFIANEALEIRVKERTRELEQTNLELEEEIAERQAAQEMLQEQTAVLEEEIAEREQAQEQLRQSRKLEAIGSLAGGVAHDFNNLLTPIMGYAGMIELGLPENSPLLEKTKGIMKAAESAKRLTNQLLSFGRKQVLDMRLIELNEIIGSFHSILRRTIRENINIELTLTPQDTLVKADKGQIEQILLNLSINAMDSIVGIGLIKIETFQVLIDDESVRIHPGMLTGKFVMLVFSDSGSGMDNETLSHIFEPFFTTKHVGHGTGLGLATVYGIVKQHEGFVEVASAEGEGTVFSIYLPLCVGEQEKIGSPCIDIKQNYEGSETILVVEDNEDVCDMLVDILDSVGYTVHAASTPREALRIAENLTTPIDLLVTDVVMPDMNGHMLYEQLLLTRPNLKVIYISGYADDINVHHGILAKPFRGEELLERIRLIMG